VVDLFLPPQYYVNYPARTEVSASMTAVKGLDARLDAQSTLDNIQETSTDPYATLRSYYQQNRESQIHGADNLETLPEFDTPDESQPQPQPQPDAQPQPAAPHAAPESPRSSAEPAG
jgi:ABC-type transporter lipoprotein component MlaA